ncbi:MAG TPA: hypothetical protein VLJ60_10965, partial [bacterium]|nr:hypothetical protein [bacterium]
PKHLHDEVFIQKMLDSTEMEFRENIILAHDHSTENGAEFFHFLQPHLFADDRFTEYEKELMENKYLMPKGVEESFVAGYPHLQEVTAELSKSLNSFDLTGILDNHTEGDEYFLDSVHVNHTANRVIAENIFRNIKVTLY